MYATFIDACTVPIEYFIRLSNFTRPQSLFCFAEETFWEYPLAIVLD